MSLYVKQSSQRCQTRQHWTGCLDTVGERVCMLVTYSTLSTVIEKLGACCNKSKRPGYTSTLSAIIFCISLCFAGFPVLFIVVEQFQHYLIKFLGTIIDHPSETVAGLSNAPAYIFKLWTFYFELQTQSHVSKNTKRFITVHLTRNVTWWCTMYMHVCST